jgi:hypothetical protein
VILFDEIEEFCLDREVGPSSLLPLSLSHTCPISDDSAVSL